MSRVNRLDVVAFVKGSTVLDYDNDGRPDLFLSVQDGRSLLFHNDGPKPATATEKARWGFTEVAEAAGVTGQRSTFPCWSFDYDHDGFEDLFVAGYRIRTVGEVVADLLGMASPAERSRLYRNRGDGTFEDVSKVVGLDRVLHAMGSNFGDLDNDGWLDFYLGTGDPNFATLIPNRMFRNDGGRRFQDVTTRGGFGTLQKGHAVAFADFDNDGDQDVYEDLGGAYVGDQYPNVLLENPGHGNHWIKLRLEGRQANRSGIGARIRVRCRGPEGERVIHRTCNTGGSFGANPLRLEIGLGKATEVSAIEIDWPGSRTRQTVKIPKVDTAYLVREGELVAQAMELRRFGFARTPAAMDHSHLLLRPPPPSPKSSSPPERSPPEPSP
ncbi:MAG: CRTAC1 family protein [Verrucomicrobiota bacterium]